MADIEIKTFHWADYLVFSVMLVISAAIGIWFGFRDRKKKSTKDFLLGGGDLNILPVGISILASFTSAIAILGFSAEMYKYGTMYWIIVFSYPLTQILAAFVYIPHFHRLGITSAYQYLDMRFNKLVRLAASIIFCLQMFLYMAVALYTPALAIEQVTGIPLIISIVLTGAICAFYTVVGGMKATVWIDTFQVGIMFIGLAAVVIKGALSIDGGMKEVFKRASDSDRLEFFNFNLNPFQRHTFWTLIFGGFLTNLTVYGSNQGTIQRYLTIKKWQNAAKALMINLVGGMILLTLTCLSGLVAYAKYYQCNILGNQISRSEQLLPFLVMDILGDLPGLPGLFVATVYSAALSTISAGMNSLAAVCITDFYKPFYLWQKKKPIDETIAGWITKGLALFFGAAAIGLAYLCQYLGNTVLQLTLSIFGLLGGPLLGVISLGMFVPYANWVGALVGLLLSAAMNLWVGVGSVAKVPPNPSKYLTTEGCATTTAASTTNQLFLDGSFFRNEARSESEGIVYFYKLSYLYYSAQALLVVFIFGILFSFIAYKAKWVERKPLDRKLWVNRDLYKKKDEEPQVESNELQVVAIVTNSNKVHPAERNEKAETMIKGFIEEEQPSEY